MSKLSILGCVVTAIIGLAVMCLCSLILTPAWSSFAAFLVFVCFGAVIAAIVLNRSNSRRTKITALCIFIGLIGIATMQLCNLLIMPPFSGIAGFLVFIVFAAVISAIIVKQRKFFNAEHLDFLKDQSKREAALRLIYILKEKGVSSMEIRRVIAEKFNFQTAMIDELMNTAGL